MDAVDHGKVVLGTIFKYRAVPALDHALARLSLVSFTDPIQQHLFALTERQLDIAQSVLTRAALGDILRDQAPGTTLKYGEYYDALLQHAVPISPEGFGAFLHSVEQLRELATERRTGDALATAMQILRQGWKDGQVELRGHEASRSYLVTQLSLIDRELRKEEAPEGLMQAEAPEIISNYIERAAMRERGQVENISTGLPPLDDLLGGGLERGELDLVAAWTSAGKTSFCVHLAWHAAVMQGKFVVFFTSETLRPQVRIKILARHSRLPQFGLGQGLNSSDIKAGRLPPAGFQALQAVATDFARSSGGIYIAQTPKGATITEVEARLERITRGRVADLVVVDSLQLLRSDVHRRSQWEASAAMVKDAKHVAVDYRHGLGVPLVTPWQVSRAGYEAARERGFYLTGDLSETKEAENSADVLISLMAPRDYSGGRLTELLCSLLKNRDGEARFGASNSINLTADYATSYFTARSTSAGQSLLEMNMGDAPFGGM